MRSNRNALIGSLLAAIAFSGCATSKPVDFYRLNGLKERAPAESVDDTVMLGVGPVTLAEYLKRPQIIVRKSSISVSAREYDRWIEPLEESVPRILAGNFETLLGTKAVFVYPFRLGIDPKYKIRVSVRELDYNESDAVVKADFHWVLLQGRDEVIMSGRFVKQNPSGSSIEEQVKGLSGLLADFSRDVTGKIQTTVKTG